MFCGNCGKQFEGQFCPYCGTRVNNVGVNEQVQGVNTSQTQQIPSQYTEQPVQYNNQQPNVTYNEPMPLETSKGVYEFTSQPQPQYQQPIQQLQKKQKAPKPPKVKKPIYKRVWVWIIAAIVLLFVIIGISNSCKDQARENARNQELQAVLNWPTTGLATKLPTPKSTTGKIVIDSVDTFSVDVSNITKDDFKAYIEACKGKGFVEDYYASDARYDAKDKEGYDLSLYYDDKKQVMDIHLNSPKDETKNTETKKIETEKATEATKEKPTETAKSDNAGTVTPSFKELMDSYEEFVKEYVDFMKRYADSDDITGMLTEYQEYITKLQEWEKKVEDYKSNDLTLADLDYYAQVNERILKMLYEVE